MRSSGRSALHGAAAVVVAGLVFLGCGDDAQDTSRAQDDFGSPTTTAPIEPSADGPTFHPVDNPDVLSDWGQLVSSDGQLSPNAEVTPYTLNSALFSDYAGKLRTVWLPEGAAPASYDEHEAFGFPVGTVITKTFYYQRAEGDAGSGLRVIDSSALGGDPQAPLDLETIHLVETRVLAHREDGWVALPYVWNGEQDEATLKRVGDLVSMTLVDGTVETPFPYVVPDANQCAGCHATNHTTKEILPIGPKARHLNLDADFGTGPTSQLDHWSNLGLVTGLPESSSIPRSVVWEDDGIDLEQRARAYLDINCAHCHNTNGPADTSGLFLESTTDLGPRLGVCKPPVAAGTGTGGRRVGIHPGEPDDSIFVFRMESTDPGAMMPELGRSLTHREGVELIAQWIDSLDGGCSS